MDFRKVAKAFATKHNLEYDDSRRIYDSIVLDSSAINLGINDEWEFVVTRMLKVYGIHRYTFEMWSEIVERDCFKRHTNMFKEWGIDCAYCAVFCDDCDNCPLKSCSRGSAFYKWNINDDLNGAIEVRDIAKERMNELS